MKEEVTRKIKYLVTKESGHKIYPNLMDVAKSALEGIYTYKCLHC